MIALQRFYSLNIALIFLAMVIAHGLTGCGSSSSDDPVVPPAIYTVSGSISGGVDDSVTITLSGAASATTVSDTSGNYSFSDLAVGDYTLTPSIANYTFEPASINFTLSGDTSGLNFSSIGDVSGTITGDVTNGVTINLSGASTGSTITDVNGNYSFEGLAHGEYILTPAMAGYTFDPLSITISFGGVALTANNFVSTLASTASISGAVSGDIDANVPITLSIGGSPVSSTFTDSNGDYIFNGLTIGLDYQVSASRIDYTFIPSSIDIIDLQANVIDKDFTSTSHKQDMDRYTVSGTVSYGGTSTGVIYIMLQHSNGYMSMYGTSINAAGAYSIRGVTDGDYTIVAIMDKFDSGYMNVSDPLGGSAPFTVSGIDVSGISVNLLDPSVPTPVEPGLVITAPFDQGTVVLWEAPYVRVNDERFEIADAYDVYWNTSATVGPGNNIGSVIVPAGGEMGHYIVNGLTNGTTLYFGVRAKVGATNSAVTINGPVTIGAPVGGSTISGEVSYTGAASGPLYIAVVESGDSPSPNLYVTHIASPTSPQSYSVTGIADGSYQVVAAIDMNNNNVIMDLGDLSAESMDDGPSIDIAGNNVIHNMDLNSENVLARVSTRHVFDALNVNFYYETRTELARGVKRPIRAVVTGGPGINVPVDLAPRGSEGDFEGFFWNVPRPAPGDPYTYELTYSDTTSETVTTGVTALLDSFAVPVYPIGSVPGDTRPTFTWSAPAAPPPVYFYELEVHSINQNIWGIWDKLPSTVTSVEYNFDGNASLDPLISNETYSWFLHVLDEQGNYASVRSEFTP
jgi:hypothetical protein